MTEIPCFLGNTFYHTNTITVVLKAVGLGHASAYSFKDKILVLTLLYLSIFSLSIPLMTLAFDAKGKFK